MKLGMDIDEDVPVLIVGGGGAGLTAWRARESSTCW